MGFLSAVQKKVAFLRGGYQWRFNCSSVEIMKGSLAGTVAFIIHKIYPHINFVI